MVILESTIEKEVIHKCGRDLRNNTYVRTAKNKTSFEVLVKEISTVQMNELKLQPIRYNRKPTVFSLAIFE